MALAAGFTVLHMLLHRYITALKSTRGLEGRGGPVMSAEGSVRIKAGLDL